VEHYEPGALGNRLPGQSLHLAEIPLCFFRHSVELHECDPQCPRGPSSLVGLSRGCGDAAQQRKRYHGRTAVRPICSIHFVFCSL
jgi:hypothetical protein